MFNDPIPFIIYLFNIWVSSNLRKLLALFYIFFSYFLHIDFTRLFIYLPILGHARSSWLCIGLSSCSQRGDFSLCCAGFSLGGSLLQNRLQVHGLQQCGHLASSCNSDSRAQACSAAHGRCSVAWSSGPRIKPVSLALGWILIHSATREVHNSIPFKEVKRKIESLCVYPHI